MGKLSWSVIWFFVLSCGWLSQVRAELGRDPFASSCEDNNRGSDDCLDCAFMTQDAPLVSAWLRPEPSSDCRLSKIVFKLKPNGHFDVISVDQKTGRQNIVFLEKTLPEVAGNFNSSPAEAQQSLETDGSELFKRSQYEIWGSRVRVKQVIQNMKPTGAASLEHVAQIALSYELADLPAQRIYKALSKVNFYNSNSPIGSIIRPVVHAIIGEESVQTRKVNACLLRKTKNDFINAIQIFRASRGYRVKPLSHPEFFCLDNQRRSCGDCFFDSSNNLKDIAYQIVQPENSVQKSIEDALTKVLQVAKPTGKSSNQSPNAEEPKDPKTQTRGQEAQPSAAPVPPDSTEAATQSAPL